MAIIYSYPLTSSLEGSDLIIVSRHEEASGFKTLNANIDSILNYVSTNYTGSQDLNQVLTNGNVSLLNAKIGQLYLYDSSPVFDDYFSIRADKGRFNFYNNNDFSYGYIGRDTLFLKDGTSDYGLFIVKPDITLENREAKFQDKSGTVAYLSDIPLTNNYGLYAGTSNSEDITNTTSEKTLIPDGVGTLSVPANTFNVGDSFRAVIGGNFSCANNQDFSLRIKINDIIILDSGIQNCSNITNDTFYLNIDFTIRSVGESGEVVSLGSFHYTKQSNNSVQGFSFKDVVEIDTTVDNTLDVTFQWAQSNQSNSIITQTFVLNKTY